MAAEGPVPVAEPVEDDRDARRDGLRADRRLRPLVVAEDPEAKQVEELVKSGKDLATAAKAAGSEIKTSDMLIRSSSLPEFGSIAGEISRRLREGMA